MNRNEFLHKFSLLCFSCSDFVRKQITFPSVSSIIPTKKNILAVDKFIDLHCHPNLKYYLWGKKIWKKHPSRKGSNVFNLQVDVNKVITGNVQGFLVAHYLPEKGLVTESRRVGKFFPVMRLFAPGLIHKIEEHDEDNFSQVLQMIENFEKQVTIANGKLTKENPGKDIIRIAKSYKAFEDNLNAGIISVAQTIEGAHALGRATNDSSPSRQITNLEILFDKGICLVTLAHFFPNDICSPVEGMPPYNKESLKYKWNYDPQSGDKLLTPLGKNIVTKMLELGMIVDVTHLSPLARNEVFEINKKFNRPVIFTHTGVQHLFNGPPQYEHYKFYCASDEDIANIKQCNGVLGIIFMNYFLTGVDQKLVRDEDAALENAVTHIIDTITYIRLKTGSYENIALGSDFDNFATTPSDLRDASCFPKLLEGIRKITGIKEEEIAMITHGNALRVLRDGWKR